MAFITHRFKAIDAVTSQTSTAIYTSYMAFITHRFKAIEYNDMD